MRIWLTSISLLLVLGAWPVDALAAVPFDQAISKAIETQSKDSIGLAIIDVESGKYLFSHNPDKPFIPASVAKIITTYAALKYLGDGYRFPTEVFADRSILKSYLARRNEPRSLGHVGNIYFRGYGDPGVVDETLWTWAKDLHQLGIRSVDNLVVDDTLFIDPASPRGNRPYQAGYGALSVNHNCYAVTIAPGAPGQPAIVSLTPGVGFSTKFTAKSVRSSKNSIKVNQNPLSQGYQLPVAKTQGSAWSILDPRSVSVSVKGNIRLSNEPITRYYTAPHSGMFFAALMKHHLAQAGIEVRGQLLKGETPAEAKEIKVFRSKRLGTLLMDLNQYSNNFIAEQLLYAIGQDSSGYFRHDMALSRIKALLEQLGIEEKNYELYDGSGLDRRSRLSAAQLVKVLFAGSKDISISPLLISSLSHFGKTGTLKKRSLPADYSADSLSPVEQGALEIREQGIWAKTGTLDGVSSLAGYAKNAEDNLVAFVILINGSMAKSKASQIEESILRAIVSNPLKATAGKVSSETN